MAATPAADAAAVDAMRDELVAGVRHVPCADSTSRTIGFRVRRRAGNSTAPSRCSNALPRACPPDAAKLLAVTDARPVHPRADLRLRTGPTRTAASASSRWRACGRSSTACRPIAKSSSARAVKEALHETGHLFGLVHCADPACAMSLSTGVRQIDRKEAAFCAACAGALAAPARGADRYEDPLADSGCRRRRSDVRIPGRVAARGRVRRRHRLLRPRSASRRRRARDYAIYFVDLKMPGGMDGIETMMQIRRLHPEASIIIITAYATVDTAITAMKEGAQEYIVKPCNPEEISLLVSRIIKVKNLQRENTILRKKLDPPVQRARHRQQEPADAGDHGPRAARSPACAAPS